MSLLVLECLYLLLYRFGGPQDGFFGFCSVGYLEGGNRPDQEPVFYLRGIVLLRGHRLPPAVIPGSRIVYRARGTAAFLRFRKLAVFGNLRINVEPLWLSKRAPNLGSKVDASAAGVGFESIEIVGGETDEIVRLLFQHGHRELLQQLRQPIGNTDLSTPTRPCHDCPKLHSATQFMLMLLLTASLIFLKSSRKVRSEICQVRRN